jgi:hypothetical protein
MERAFKHDGSNPANVEVIAGALAKIANHGLYEAALGAASLARIDTAEIAGGVVYCLDDKDDRDMVVRAIAVLADMVVVASRANGDLFENADTIAAAVESGAREFPP